MIYKRFLSIGLVAAAALGLGACTDPYSYGRAPGYYDNVGYYSQWDRYYGDPFGFRYVPVGFVGAGFGWFGNHYYPGVGNWVYDRRGVRRAWNRHQQAYWVPRVTQRQRWQRDNGFISNRIAGGIVRGNQLEGQQNQILRQGNRIERRENQIAREQLDVQRQANRIDRRQLRQDRRDTPVTADRPQRVERPQQQARVERPMARSQQQMRQQYQRQQQGYREGRRQGYRQPRN